MQKIILSILVFAYGAMTAVAQSNSTTSVGCNTPTAQKTITNGRLSANLLNAGDGFHSLQGKAKFFPDNVNFPGVATLYASSLWLSAYDSNGDLCLAAQTYRQTNGDYFAGPLSAAGTVSSADCTNYDRIWSVTSADINAVISDYNDNGVINNAIPTNILGYPCRNNANFQALFGFSLPANTNFAPFKDRNNNGNYEPNLGDYPIIPNTAGQTVPAQMAFCVFNDQGNGQFHNQSRGGKALKAEIQATFYTLNSTVPFVQSTLFVSYNITNKSGDTLTDTYATIWTDADLGCYNDDYLGTSPPNNTIYAYNATNTDYFPCPTSDGSVLLGFGSHTPTQAVTFLNKSMDKSLYCLSNFFEQPLNMNINIPLRYRQTMTGELYWAPTSHIYTDAPSVPNGWSMLTEQATYRDYQLYGSTNKGAWLPNESFTLDVMYSYHTSTTPLATASVDTMLIEVPALQGYYNSGFTVLPNVVHPVTATQTQAALYGTRVFPNPATDQLYIDLGAQTRATALLTDAAGRLIRTETLTAAQTKIDIATLPQGLYLLTLQIDGAQVTHKMVK